MAFLNGCDNTGLVDGGSAGKSQRAFNGEDFVFKNQRKDLQRSAEAGESEGLSSLLALQKRRSLCAIDKLGAFGSVNINHKLLH